MASFGAQLQAFADKTGEKLEDVDVAFKFGLFADVFRLTPVDTGRLKGNWQISNGAPAQGTLERFEPVGAVLPESVTAEIQPFAMTYYTNNMEYGPYVEFGTATQAAQGFVAAAVGNATARLQRAVDSND